VAEVVIPPRSGLIGQTAFPGMVTESGDLVVLAIQRNREQLGPGEIMLAAGDSLLLRGTCNTATALIIIPIAISSAAELGVSARPVLMAVNVAAAAAFLTPVATPANMMVMEPGGYRFGDYWKLGLPLSLLVLVLGTPLILLFWPVH
jgi:di/tricarboxylate transporter